MWDASEGHDSFFMAPTSITVLDLSAYLGLVAVGALTLNMLLGLLMAFRYSPHRSWPHRRFNYFRLHNWMGYVALGVSILHPAILLSSKNPRFRILDLAYPIHSLSQPLDNTIGAIAVYLLAFVAVTSYLRIRLGRHLVNFLSNVTCATHICVDRGFISGGGSILPISALTCGSPPVGSAFRRGPLFNHLN